MNFHPMGMSFKKPLITLKMYLIIIQTHLSPIIDKCHMMMFEGIILGHRISIARIQVDPQKLR